MATNANQGRTATQARKRVSEKKKRAKKRTRIILFAVEIIVIVVMLGALYMLRDFGKSGIGKVVFEDGDIQMNEQVKENVQLKGYRNIALFGVDSRKGELEKNTLSDAIMIASINQDTGDVKLVSVYRDTFLNLSNDKYNKCNSAYSAGGPKQAINMLNLNLDLDIEDFVTVGFSGLKETIDELGGIWIEVDNAELKHINNYQSTMAQELKCSYEMVEKAGYQKLDGLQSVAYCRIRYTSGNDFKRTERQREVIQAIAEEATSADAQTLINIANSIAEAGAVYTSLEMEEILDLLKDIANYRIVDEGGFPVEEYRGTAVLGDYGDCVVPLDLEKNVEWLHSFLFEDEDYQVSDTVSEYSDYIRSKIAQYKPDMKYPE